MLPQSELFETLGSHLESSKSAAEFELELWEEYGRKLAIVVTDSCGFTRVTQEKGIVHFLTCIVKMRTIVEDTLNSNGAIYSRFEADNIYAAFDNTKQALKAMTAVNEELKKESIAITDSEYYRVCTGIGFGKVLLSKREGCYGDEMNLASKLGEDTAEGDEILLTEEAWKNLDDADRKKFEKRQLSLSGITCSYYSWRTV